jgi:hypothetical protein
MASAVHQISSHLTGTKFPDPRCPSRLPQPVTRTGGAKRVVGNASPSISRPPRHAPVSWSAN